MNIYEKKELELSGESTGQKIKEFIKHFVPVSLSRYHRIRKDQKKILENQDEILKKISFMRDSLTFHLWSLQKDDDSTFLESRKKVFRDMSAFSQEMRDMQLAVNILLVKLDKTCREHELTYWIDFGTLLGAVRHRGFIPWDDDIDVSMLRADAEKLKELLNSDEEFVVDELYSHKETNAFNHNLQLKFRLSDNCYSPYCIDIFIRDFAPNHEKDESTFEIISRNKVEHRLAANKLCNKYLEQGIEEYDPEVVDSLRSLFNQYLEKTYKEACLSRESGHSVVFGLDNILTAGYRFQGNYAYDDIFPLIELEFEGNMYLAPKNWQVQLEDRYGDWLQIPGDVFSHNHFQLSESERLTMNAILTKYGVK